MRDAHKELFDACCADPPIIFSVKKAYDKFKGQFQHVFDAQTGDFPLHIALQHGADLDVVEYLVEKYEDQIRMSNLKNILPIHLACNGPTSTVKVIEYLVEKWKASLKIGTSQGNLPLHVACVTRAPLSVVRYLLEQHKTALRVPNRFGQTPLDCAQSEAKLPCLPHVIAFLKGDKKQGSAAAEPGDKSFGKSATPSSPKTRKNGSNSSIAKSPKPAKPSTSSEIGENDKETADTAKVKKTVTKKVVKTRVVKKKVPKKKKKKVDKGDDSVTGEASEYNNDVDSMSCHTNTSTGVDTAVIEAAVQQQAPLLHGSSDGEANEGLINTISPIDGKGRPLPQIAEGRSHKDHQPDVVAAISDDEESKDTADIVAVVNKHDSFEENYDLGGELGDGAYSIVRQGTERSTGTKYAVKIVNRKRMSREDEDRLHNEMNLLQRLSSHPNILKLFEVFADRKHYYMVLELMGGGELFDRVVSKTTYTEREARDTCFILFDAIQYCHRRRVAHRDLKPENLLLKSSANDWDLKIADFGLAKYCPKPFCLQTSCGTPSYAAPEIIMGNAHDFRVDLWSLGVIVFILLGGYPPFDESDQMEMYRQICSADFVFDPRYWSGISAQAQDLICGLMKVDPAERLSAVRILQQHEWMTEDLDGHDLGANLRRFKKYNVKRKFKGAVNSIMLSRRLTSAIK